jgi:hypothetical protein
LDGVGRREGEFRRRGGEETRFGWSKKGRRGVLEKGRGGNEVSME